MPVAWLQPLGNGACANHPEAPATGVCERCGDLVCAGCSRFMGDRRYCAPCVAALRGVEGRRTSGRVWWMAGAWSVFLLVLIVLWAVLALAR